MKQSVKRILVMTMVASLVPTCMVSAKTEKVVNSEDLEYLGKELQASSDYLMNIGEDVEDIYSELHWSSIADTFPAKFDLRDRGTVTPVKSQDPWGTCWSFATCSASEVSILNSLGMTADEYKEKYGEELNLSERHLAWFTTKALPELDEFPDGEYPYDPSQAGEGLHFMGEDDVQPFNAGGNYFLSTTSLADGIGILKEKYAPYENNEGNTEKSGDWSLPEEERYSVTYELKDANILPSPATYDSNGNYVYRPEATEAIKSELLSGRAVGIAFKADHAMPETTVEEKKKELEKSLSNVTGVTEDEKKHYIEIRAGAISTDDLSDDELRELIIMRCKMNDMAEDTYDLKSLKHDQLVEVLMTKDFGKSFETIHELYNKEPYMFFVGEDNSIFAHYTYENVQSNHAVTVVGWDDTFSKEEWPEDRRPEGDGVWIVKNSWGTEWGNDGYFLLSYYDKSLCGIGSFEYVVSEDHSKLNHLSIMGYDKMPAVIISSTLFDTPVYSANIFEMSDDSVLEYVAAMTGDMDASVTANIFLLNENAEKPTDGVLLDSVTENFKFAGYHRIKLNDNLVLRKGTRISVVIMENVPVEGGTKYALVNSSSLSKDGAEAFNKLHENDGMSVMRYAKAVVNPGESYISFDLDNWTDWTDAIAVFSKKESNQYMAYDNLPIKAYLYPLDEVESVHDLSDKIPAVGGEAAVCPEDGYTLLEVTGE